MSFSIVITIHDEERNIGRLLERLLDEPLAEAGLERIVVVSSASTDCSDEIVREVEQRSELVRLVVEDERRGKASAINLGLAETRSSGIIVLMSGDIIPERGAVGLFVAAFDDPEIGMVGGRPMPTGEPSKLIHRIALLQWELHHEVALHSPKLGEAVAFRNEIESIPVDTAVDEAAIEAVLRERGYRFAYLPDAIIHNKGPETIGDFLKQRRRIAAGHEHLAKTQGYEVATADKLLVLRVTARVLLRDPRKILTALAAAMLELQARLLGLWDLHVRGKNPYIWDISASTKDPSTKSPTVDRAEVPQ